MSHNQEKTWVWEKAGDYDRRTSSEAGLYYERYHDLLDLVVVRCRVKQGDWVLDIGTGTGELARRFAQNRECRVVGLRPDRVWPAAENGTQSGPVPPPAAVSDRLHVV